VDGDENIQISGDAIVARRVDGSNISGGDLEITQNIVNIKGVPPEKHADVLAEVKILQRQIGGMEAEIESLRAEKQKEPKELNAAKEVIETANSITSSGANFDPMEELRLSDVAFLAGQLEKAEGSVKQALREFRVEGDRAGEAAALLKINWFERNKGRIKHAEKLIEESLHISQDLADINGTVEAMLELAAFARFIHSDLDKARKLLDESLIISKTEKIPSLEANCLGSLAGLEWTHGNIESAISMFEKSIKLKNENHIISTHTIVEYARLRQSLADYEGAEDLLQRALKINLQYSNRPAEADCFHFLAHLASDAYRQGSPPKDSVAAKMKRSEGIVAMEKTDLADEYHEKALKIFREIGWREREAQILYCMGVDQFGRKKEFDAAEKMLIESLEIYRNINFRHGEARALHSLGHLFFEKGDLEEADRKHHESLVISRELGDYIEESKLLTCLGVQAIERQDLDDSKEYHEMALDIRRNKRDRKGESQSLHYLGHIAEARNNDDYAAELMDEALEISHELGDFKEHSILLKCRGNIEERVGNADRAKELRRQSHQQFTQLQLQGDWEGTFGASHALAGRGFGCSIGRTVKRIRESRE